MKVTSTQRIAVAGLSLALGLLGCGGPTPPGTESATEKPAATAKMMAPMALYDLTVLSVSAPASAARNATINVVHTTKNVGTALAPSSTSKFHLCTNNVACGLINSQSVPGLAAGASKTLTNSSFTIPAGQPLGTNYIVVVCATNLADNKSNNTNSTVIVITP
jgi:hypothetical protein